MAVSGPAITNSKSTFPKAMSLRHTQPVLCHITVDRNDVKGMHKMSFYIDFIDIFSQNVYTILGKYAIEGVLR